MKARIRFSIAIFLIPLLALAGCQTLGLPAGPASATRPPGASGALTIQPYPIPNKPQKSSPTPTVQTVPVQLQVNPDKLRGIVIQFWHPWTGAAAQIFADRAYEFNTTNLWGIHIEPYAAGGVGGLYDAVSSKLAAEEPTPHIVAAPIEQLTAWQEYDNIVLDLNPYIFSTEWGFSDDQRNDFQPVFWEQDQIEGRQLGIPAQRTARVLFYNQSWAKELGFDKAPTTSTAFQAQACAAAQSLLDDDIRENNGTGGYITISEPLTTLSWMQAFDADLPDLDFADYHFNTDESLAAFTFVRAMFDEGCAWISRLPEPYEYFAKRQALFYSGTLQDLTTQAQTNRRLGNPDQWIILPFPGPEENQNVLTYGPSFAILAASPEEQLASWLFIRWMSVPRNQVELVEATDALPVSQTAVQMLGEYQRRFPQWATALSWMPNVQPPPRGAEWRTVRRMLEDLTWQVHQDYVVPSDFPKYLRELDQMVAELFE